MYKNFILFIFILLLIFIGCKKSKVHTNEELQNRDLFSYYDGEKWGFRNKYYVIIVECKYSLVDSFIEDRAAVQIKGKWGFVDTDGKEITSLKYDHVNNFNNGLAKFNIGGWSEGRWGFIDKEGKEIIDLTNYVDADMVHFSEDRAVVVTRNSGEFKWGFIDKEGKEVIPLKYDNARDFKEGLAAVNIGFIFGKWGFINKEGKEVIPVKYDFVLDFSEGLAAAELNNKWGFINIEGKNIIPFKYDEVEKFQKGNAVVKLNGKTGFVNKNGKEFWKE